MKVLLVLRGVAGCGKSTWVRDQGLENYTLSADKIRLLFTNPEYDIHGNVIIPNKCDKHVWNFLYERLEQRMKEGQFTVVDATHCRESSLKEYKTLAKKYKYRLVLIDFSDIDIQVIKERNANREIVVPEAAIDRMYGWIKTPLQGNYEIYKYDDPAFSLNKFLYVVNGNEYEKVVVIGDIHSCYNPLKEYFDANPISPTTLYVFVGDYLDRGLQSREVLQFCYDHREDNNFIFLTGNHEKWIKNYVRDGKDAQLSGDFKTTLNQLGDLVDLLPDFARRLKVSTIVKVKAGETTNWFYITHAGIPQPLSYRISAVNITQGIGAYEDQLTVDESFCKFNDNELIKATKQVYYTVHGHRNVFDQPVINGCAVNLEGKVEFGGSLRILEISVQDDKLRLNPVEIHNEYFDVNAGLHKQNKAIIYDLDHSPLIHKKELGDNVVSYNFSRDAFYDKKWNRLTTTARGLFVDSVTGDVVARSYPKFFAIEEHPSTEWRSLHNKLKFPVAAYFKENGFLGIVSVRNGELFIASKSTNQGEYKENFERILRKTVDCEALLKYLQETNCSAIFECIDPVNDPHIIDYLTEDVVLLDIVQNDFTNTFKSYQEVCDLSALIGCRCKALSTVFNNMNELQRFISEEESGVSRIEGYVLVDQNNFMVKYKTPFYKFWKQMRTLKEKMVAGKVSANSFMTYRVAPQFSDLVPVVYNYMNSMLNEFGVDFLNNSSIIDIRNKGGFHENISIL